MKAYKKYIIYIISIMIVGVFAVSRFWRLMTIPSGLHIDEMGMAYDAWCLSQYGVDRYMKSWPVYLMNFGGGQSVLYAYLCAGLFRLFGYSVFWLRVPGIFGSFLATLFGILLSRKLFPKRKYMFFLTGIIFTVCPYFIMASRIGLDCNLMLGFGTMFLYLFLLALEKGKYRYYVFAGIAGGLVLYTYAISYIVLPMFLILALIYVIRVGNFSFRHWAVMAIPLGVLAFPLILVQIVNILELPEMTMGIFTITRLNQYRVSEIGVPAWDNFMQTLKSIFVGDPLNYNSVAGYPTLFWMTVPLCLLGFSYSIAVMIRSLKFKKFCPEVPMLLWFFTMLVAGSMIAANSNKINGVFSVVVLLAVEGVFVLGQVWKKYAVAITTGVAVLYLICFLDFGHYYYMGKYTEEYYPLDYFSTTVSEAIDYLEQHPEEQNKGTYMAQQGICFALSTLQSPEEMGIIQDVGVYNGQYYTGSLGEIEEGFNYIVTDIYVEYGEELRALGYKEIRYPNYSLFIWKE